MSKANITIAVSLAIVMIGCSSPEGNNQETAPKTPTAPVETNQEEPAPEKDVESLIKAIDEHRNLIETSIGEPIIVNTSDLREKTKQKWEKLHFYTLEGELVRIKTYPHPATSDRTEEFYLQTGKLILAVVEDDGEGDRGKPADQIDKLYYFHEDEVIAERGAKNEPEYSVRNSDAEELLQEVNEYVDIFRKSQAKP